MSRIIFHSPATCWEEALPVGNGRMGAMIYGSGKPERIQLNEDSIWYGGPQSRINPDALPNLEKLRSLIFRGRITEAQTLLKQAFSGLPENERPYQTAGDLLIEWENDEKPGSVERELDMETGTVRSIVQCKAGAISKEYLASFPEQVLAIRMKAEGDVRLTFMLHFERQEFCDQAGKLGEDGIFLEGNLGEGASHFLLAAKAVVKDGAIETLGRHLSVKGAKEVVIYLAMETSFYCGSDYKHVARERLKAAAGKGYESIYDRHVQDYQSLMGKMELKLEGEAEELKFAETYFQYGRYMSISSSRPGSQPANLQGVWNCEMAPPWESKYTININTEMNYWLAESCNLSECHLPLFDLLKRMHQRGKEVAEKMYGCRGFTAHHNTDLWADCAPQDIYIPATYWPMGGAWLCTHIWTHYRYTLNRAFLEEMYPVLKDAVLFFHDYLVEDKGELVTCPSVSPENTYILPEGGKGCICAGASMDTQILRDLFSDYLNASRVLGIQDDITVKTEEMITKLSPLKIGKHGQVMEWREDYDEAEPGHRHISQLYALYPSQQITADGSPELAVAARKTLERRLQYGGGHTGWSCAWIAGLYARLGDGDSAWKNLQKLWEESTFPNLMNNHPIAGPAGDGYVFQIDGNFGATAAMAEMLVWSSEDRTVLLPALPLSWKNGSVKGLVIDSGAIVNMKWKDHRLIECSIQAVNSMETVLYWGDRQKQVSLNAGEVYTLF